MDKKKIILLIVFFMAISILVQRLDVNAATSDLQILFNNNGNTATSSNMINANFKVINNGLSSINLADLKFRYYYTADSDTAQNFFCDHAGMMNGWSYSGVTDKVTGTFCKMYPAISKADTYLEVGFKSDAGTLSAGGYIEIQTRVARTDWTNYDQSNDYSFNTFSTYGENDKIVAALRGTNISGNGNEIEIKAPVITPTVITYDKYYPTNLSVTLEPNGNTFKGITGLTHRTDYVVSGNTVTILKSCIDNLPIGSKVLTFDFGALNNPTLTLTVKDTTPKPRFDATIGTATGAPGDTVTVPISFKNVAKAGNVGACNFYVDYDATLLEAVSVAPGSIVTNPVNNFSSKIDATKGTISFAFLDNTIGDEMIKIDGDFALITFKIKSTATETTTPVVFLDEAAFPNFTLVSMANTYNGSVAIKLPQMVAPTITPSSASFTMGISSDITVALSPNGNVFKGIIGLTKGVDYTVSGDTVTILRSYLNSLTSGTKSLTFDFGVVANPVLTISGLDCPCSSSVKIGTAKGTLGDTVTVPITISHVRYVGNVGCFNFDVKYDKTLLEAVSVKPGNVIINPDINFGSRITNTNTTTGSISVVFLDNTIGDELITTDGILLNITFKIIGTKDTITPIVFGQTRAFGNGEMAKISYMYFANGSVTIDSNCLSLSVGEVTGKEGEIVTVPINFKNAAKMGNVMSCDFKVNYDTNLLEAVSVVPGSIVTNAEDNFGSYINTTGGAISFLFLDSTEESQSISEDGVFANINFKLKTPTEAEIVTPVEIKEVGAFGDINLKNIPYLKTNGSVTIIRTTLVEAKIEPSTTSFILGNPGLTITLCPNGNIFNGISGLRQGNDYTVSGSIVTILASYMNSLGVGTKEFTFDFGSGDKNPVLAIEVTVGTPTMTPNYIAVYKNNPKDMSVIIKPNGNTFNGIVGLKEGTDYTVSGNTVTILMSYMNSLEIGTKELTFDFGVTKNPVLFVRMMTSSAALDVRIGVATGRVDDIVAVPITFAGVSEVGNVGTCNFYIGYDKTLLEAVSVTAGDIITNAGVNFSYKIDSTKGVISIVFLDNTIGDELIKQDGVFAYIKFKRVATISTTTAVKFNEGGAFGDGNFCKLENVRLRDGSVTIY